MWPSSSTCGAAIKVVAVALTLNLFAQTAAADPDCKIAMLGDSLAAGFGVAEGEALPARIEQALRARGLACAVLNAGVSGDTSAGGRARLDWVLAERPSHLLLELGGNDGLRGLPIAELEGNLAAVIEAAQRQGIPVFLIGMLAPPNFGREYADAFRAVYSALAARYGLPLYDFLLDGAITEPALMQSDRIHPNAAGVDVIVGRITPTLVQWLRTTGVGPNR